MTPTHAPSGHSLRRGSNAPPSDGSSAPSPNATASFPASAKSSSLSLSGRGAGGGTSPCAPDAVRPHTLQRPASSSSPTQAPSGHRRRREGSNLSVSEPELDILRRLSR